MLRKSPLSTGKKGCPLFSACQDLQTLFLSSPFVEFPWMFVDIHSYLKFHKNRLLGHIFMPLSTVFLLWEMFFLQALEQLVSNWSFLKAQVKHCILLQSSWDQTFLCIHTMCPNTHITVIVICLAVDLLFCIISSFIDINLTY